MNRQFDPDAAVAAICGFLKEKLAASGLSGYVVGLSGGIDSAVSVALAFRAVGAERVFALLMPYRSSSPDAVNDAASLADRLGIEYRVVDISPMIDAYFTTIDESNRLRAGNKMARERMAVLFDVAHEMNRLVLGTGNRTEICLGYTTWYGDSACSVNPVGQLYKSELRQLAHHLDLPSAITGKTPTADLWTDQTDEGEIGVSYERIDGILQRVVDLGVRSEAALVQEGFELEEIRRVISMVNGNAFKRQLPEIAPLGKVPIPPRIELETGHAR
jgi:NAD+ synthase